MPIQDFAKKDGGETEKVTSTNTDKSDADGEMIILKGGDVMIGAPFKEIAKMIEKARKRK